MQANVSWSVAPHPGFFINSVDISADGQTVVAGTFFHVYGSTSDSKQSQLAATAKASSNEPNDDPSQYGVFGTYVYDGNGNLLQKFEFNGWQGVFSVAISADGQTVASGGWASGGTTPVGLLAAYDVASGTQLLGYGPPSRTNSVVMDQAGLTILAAADQGYLSVRSAGQSFTAPLAIALTDSTDFASVAAISADGSTGAVLSYHGELIVFRQTGGVISIMKNLTLPIYSHTIAMSADGLWVFCAGSTPNVYGISVEAFLQTPAIAWTASTPTGAKPIYALTTNSDGSIVCNGANAGTGGYVMQWRNRHTQVDFDWEVSLPHPPNGLSMDANCVYVGVAAGYQTEGAFFLLSDATQGREIWNQGTTEMNWPIKISSNAAGIVGGSDDGFVYYFLGAV